MCFQCVLMSTANVAVRGEVVGYAAASRHVRLRIPAAHGPCPVATRTTCNRPGVPGLAVSLYSRHGYGSARKTDAHRVIAMPAG